MDTAAWRGAGRGGTLTASSPHGYCSVTWSRERRDTHCQFTTWIQQRDVEQGEAGHSLPVHEHGYCSVPWSRERRGTHYQFTSMDTAASRGAGRGGALTTSSPHGYCSVPWSRERRGTHYQFTTWIQQRDVEQGEAGHSLPVHHMDTAAWRGAGRGGALTTSSPHGYCSVVWSRERRGTHYQFTTWILQRDVEQGEAGHSLPVHHMDTAAWRGAGRGGALTTSSRAWILQRPVEQGEAGHSLPVHHMDTAAWRGAGRGGALTTSSPHGYCSVTWSRERRGTHYQFTTWILQRDVEQGEAVHSLPVHHMDTAAWRGAGRGGALTTSSPHGYCSVPWSRERRCTHYQFTTWILQRDVEQGEAGHSLPVHHMDTAASRGAGRGGALTTSSPHGYCSVTWSRERRGTHYQFTTWILQRPVEQGEAGHSLPVRKVDGVFNRTWKFKKVACNIRMDFCHDVNVSARMCR